MMNDFFNATPPPVPFSLFHETGAIRGTVVLFALQKEFLSEAPPDFFACNVDIVSSAPIAAFGDESLVIGSCVAGLVAVPVARGFPAAFGTTAASPGLSGRCGSEGPVEAQAARRFLWGWLFTKRRIFLDLTTPEDCSIVPDPEKGQADGTFRQGA